MPLTLSRTHTRGSDYGEVHVIGFGSIGSGCIASGSGLGLRPRASGVKPEGLWLYSPQAIQPRASSLSQTRPSPRRQRRPHTA